MATVFEVGASRRATITGSAAPGPSPPPPSFPLCTVLETRPNAAGARFAAGHDGDVWSAVGRVLTCTAGGSPGSDLDGLDANGGARAVMLRREEPDHIAALVASGPCVWCVARDGGFTLFHAETRAVAATGALGRAVVTAAAAPASSPSSGAGGGSVLVGCFDGDVSELLLLEPTPDLLADTADHASSVRSAISAESAARRKRRSAQRLVRARGLFRVQDAFVRVVPLGPRGAVVACVSRSGAVDLWDMDAARDVSLDFGGGGGDDTAVAPCIDTEAHGACLCAAGGHATPETPWDLWVGTEGGGVVVLPLTPPPSYGASPLSTPASPREPCLLEQHGGAVADLAVMGGGRTLWSAGRDGQVVVWAAATRSPLGSVGVPGAPLAALSAGAACLVTDVWAVDVKGTAQRWAVREPVSGATTVGHATGPPQASGAGSVKAAVADTEAERDAIADAVRGLCSILSDGTEGAGADAVPPEAEERLPELGYVRDALLSMAECTETVGRTLPQIGREPSTLVDDVDAIAAAAVELAAVEEALRTRAAADALGRERRDTVDAVAALVKQAALGRDDARSSGARLEAAERQRDAAAHGEASMRAELDVAHQELTEARASLVRLQGQLAAAKRRASEAASPGGDRSPSIAASSASTTAAPQERRLREELSAKNAFVQELLQIVKENTQTIEDLRERNAHRKAEVQQLQRDAKRRDAGPSGAAELQRLREEVAALQQWAVVSSPDAPALTARLLALPVPDQQARHYDAVPAPRYP